MPNSILGSAGVHEPTFPILGLTMSSNCFFEQHIIELCKRCTGLCGCILRTFSSRESTVMMTLFKSLVPSRLDYGSQIWSPTKIHQIIMVEKIQKAFTKHIKGFSSFSYQERLSNLKIYSLQHRRQRFKYIIIYSWKILENLVPNLVKPLQFYVSDRRGHLCSVSHVRLGHTLILGHELILALGGKVLYLYIYYRFIVRFPIGLDFPLITLPFQGC